MREKDVEDRLVKGFKKIKGLALKFTSPGTAGVPDRIVIYQGNVFFVELKAPGKQLTALQKAVIRKMRAAGAVVFVIDTIEGVDALINKVKEGFDLALDGLDNMTEIEGVFDEIEKK